MQDLNAWLPIQLFCARYILIKMLSFVQERRAVEHYVTELETVQ